MGIDWEGILDAEGDDLQDAWEDNVERSNRYYENNYDEDYERYLEAEDTDYDFAGNLKLDFWENYFERNLDSNLVIPVNFKVTNNTRILI